MSRRGFLRSSAALLTVAGAEWLLTGAAPGAAAGPREDAPAPFDYARLKGLARARAAQGYVAPARHLPPVIAALDWDHWQAIRYREERALWAGEGLRFQVQFAHPGYTLNKPVRMYEVNNGAAREITFDPSLYDYTHAGVRPAAVPANLGFGGFRLLHHTDWTRDVAAFQGASYFRAVTGDAFFEGLMNAWEESWPKPRVIVLSFPHNPTTACVDLSFMERLVAFAREHEVVLVHDFAYADLGFDGYEPPSVFQVPGAKEVAVEIYTMTKSFSMAGWRVGFVVGNAAIVQALTKLKTYLDYGTFQPIQIAAIVAMNEAPDYPKEINEIYRSRRDALCDGLNRIGWHLDAPKGTMFVWAPIPEPYREMGSLEFAKYLINEGDVATSPGVGFGPGGDGHVRFALIENEQRISQAVRHLRSALTKLG